MTSLETSGAFVDVLNRQVELTEDGMYRAILRGRYFESAPLDAGAVDDLPEGDPPEDAGRRHRRRPHPTGRPAADRTPRAGRRFRTSMSMTLLRRIVSDNRRLVTAVGVLLAVDCLLYAVALYPWSRKVAQAEAGVAAAEARLVQVRAAYLTAAETDASTSRAEDRLEQFYTQVLPPDFSGRAGDPVTVSRWTGRRLRPRPRTAEQRGGSERGSRLARLHTTMVLAGEYEDVRRFIHVLETAPEFILVEEVVLSQGNESNAGLVLTLGVVDVLPGCVRAGLGGGCNRVMSRRIGVMQVLRAGVRAGSGFSFVELLVVTAILLVLASAVMR